MPPPATSVLTARIVQWDRRKGYGFLQLGKERVFLHHRDFVERHKTPAVGDEIRFTLGRDAKGRRCATKVTAARNGGGMTVIGALGLASLLVLPVIAAQRQGVDFLQAGGYVVLLSAITYWSYARDKQRAQVGEWRLSEARLHLLELLGGWPGAFLAQRRLRHKCSKVSYLVVFWLIMLLHQFAAFDSLQDWRLSRAVVDRFVGITELRR